ncbi:MAG: hypothetical protein K2H06_00005, partial [Anaeroplasmataceae bacterium]|nr:hypothetical protein [Anaeroplasmataceae bacterium]
MKKKVLTVAGRTLVTGLTLTACKPKTDVIGGSVYNKDGYTYEAAPKPYEYTGTLANQDVNVYLNYSGTAGVSYVSSTAYTNPINGETYQQGKILPTWVELGNITGTKVKDVASYADGKDDATYSTVSGQGFKTKNGEGIDLFANTVANINKMGGDGNAYDLVPFINDGKMPNFKKYLDANPSIKDQITKDGKIFYTPYFDGYNEIERMFVMDTEMVQLLLDTDSLANFDTTISGKGGDAKVLGEANYQPFLNADFNYAADTKVKVSVKAQAKEITIKKTDNIIKQQNASLATGVSGKDLAEQFRDYLKKAYGHEVGKGKTFEKYSDIFISESAAYNADELVALMRVVKANPKVVSKGLADSVEVFFPRGEASNRVANILDLAQIWGIQGLDAESNNYFFDANGKLQCLGTTQASYDALDLLHDLYAEGLIEPTFYYVPSQSANGNKGLDRYFKKTRNDSGFGFLMYDYSASIGAANDTVEGIGTDPDSRNGAFKGLSVTGIRPVLSPLTMWATEKTWKYDQALSDMTGKTLTRYVESNRTLKTGSWCIPTTAVNVEGALRLMDVTFSEYGALVNTFGPTEYWYKPTINGVKTTDPMIATDLGGSEKAPVLSQELATEIQRSKKDFWSYMRENLGATHGIGGVRNNQADFQATNAHAQVGLT